MNNNEIFIDMNIDLIRQYLNADPSILGDIKRMQDYRDLRTEEAFYSKLCNEYDHTKDFLHSSDIIKDAGEMDRSYWGYMVTSLDQQRRPKHNLALSSFTRILEVGVKNNLDYIYIGPTLSDKEINAHVRGERRSIMTKAMFRFLACIEDSVVLGTEKIEGLKNIKQNMNSFNRAYKVKKSILEDESKEKEGGIEFDFKNLLNSNENL